MRQRTVAAQPGVGGVATTNGLGYVVDLPGRGAEIEPVNHSVLPLGRQNGQSYKLNTKAQLPGNMK